MLGKAENNWGRKRNIARYIGEQNYVHKVNEPCSVSVAVKAHKKCQFTCSICPFIL